VWVRVNISPSAPYGLYWLSAVPTPLPRGALVVLPVPASVQGVWSAWVPLLKPVAGVAGDVVCRWGITLWVWSVPGAEPVSYGLVWNTAHGHPLPRWEGCLVVQEGEVFLASTVEHSLDSRYFGPVALSSIHAVATPLWTWQ
jgi:type IV secretory pathway protease TraF